MKFNWRRDSDGIGKGWLAFRSDVASERGNIAIHIGCRTADDIERLGYDRYCVFVHARYPEYAGDLPIDMPEEDLKAAAITLARLSGYLS